MRLSELQNGFKTSIFDASFLEKHTEFRASLCDAHGISVENRMKVYRNNVVQNLTSAAMAALPMTKRLVGDEFLKVAICEYVLQHIPSQGNLNAYGCTFPQFIRDYNGAQHLPYLYDFTRLEWAWEFAYYAKDDMPLNLHDLATIDQEILPELRFKFRDSFSLLASEFALDQIVDYCRSDVDDSDLELEERGVHLVIYRPSLKVEMHRISKAEYVFLDRLYQFCTISEAAYAANEIDEEFQLAFTLQKYLGLGVFSSFEINQEMPVARTKNH